MNPATSARPPYTAEDYFRLDESADGRREFRDGEILDMPGGTYEHEVIVANLVRHLGNRLDGTPCRPLGSNLRVRADRGRYTYPDVSVVCGPPQLNPQRSGSATLANPRVLIEVLSPSTESNDRGEKFRRYRRIPSLELYLLVWQSRPLVEPFHRLENGMWGIGHVVEGFAATLLLPPIGIELPLAEIYAGVTFPPLPPEAEDADE